MNTGETTRELRVRPGEEVDEGRREGAGCAGTGTIHQYPASSVA